MEKIFKWDAHWWVIKKKGSISEYNLLSVFDTVSKSNENNKVLIDEIIYKIMQMTNEYKGTTQQENERIKDYLRKIKEIYFESSGNSDK